MVKPAAIFIVCLSALTMSFAAPPVHNTKISVNLQKSLQSNSFVNILVSMVDGTSSVLNQVTRSSKFAVDQATAVYNALTAHAAKTQKPVMEMLNSARSFGVTRVESFWITNQIYIKGADISVIKSLAAMNEVLLIEEEQIIYLDDTEIPTTITSTTADAQWGIDMIQSQEAWAVAGNGTGAVVGIIDTGARHTHEAIRDSYRAGTHSWFDPYAQTQYPGDGQGHGTHVTGTVTGSNGLGVAPGAKWISCKGLRDDGSGTNAGMLACGQFMACPTTYNGGSSDCSLAPSVVSNSWGGGNGNPFFDGVIRSWHAANIIPIFANGNSGPSCSTTNSPADSQADVISVGATTVTETVRVTSSRGPSFFGTQKPDISAPGENIISASHTSDTALASNSGTSMACPHVVGLVAILKSQNPNINFDTVKNILESTADRNLVSGGQTCGNIPDTSYPNYTFGHGRINALKAVQALRKA